MQLTDFHFDLPPQLIARYPLPERSASRLLCLEGISGVVTHRHFSNILELLQPGDLLVFNDTKVIPARLVGNKATGGQVEMLVERILNHSQVLAQLRVSKPPQVGDTLFFPNQIQFEVIGHSRQFYTLSYRQHSERSALEAIESIGEIPLPPYIHRAPEDEDKERYQTVYAKYKGSVAAPTAGLHFDEPLLQRLREKGIVMDFLTLHIGAGTFTPVRTENILEHNMHAEYLEISSSLCHNVKQAQMNGKRIVAVGTTTLRALETACQSGEIEPYQGETSIFIYPGYEFRCVDALITNLHLPRSTLLMLVSAFGGFESVMQAYKAAVAFSYRFYSYGDAMWVSKR